MLSDIEFKELLDHFNRSWPGYRRVRKGVKKRVRRQMIRLGVGLVAQYIAILEANPAEMAIFETCMGVTISRFFRDRYLWPYLQDVVLPELLQSTSKGIKIWSAGCACGEEVYSLAILLELLQARHKASLLGTDFNPDNLQRAQRGIYNPSSLKEVSGQLRYSFFNKEAKGKYSVKTSLTTGIRWQLHDLFTPPPEGVFHLILLRNNLLTYHRGAAMQDALRSIVETLVPGGFLVVGCRERIGDFGINVIVDKEYPNIYRKGSAG